MSKNDILKGLMQNTDDNSVEKNKAQSESLIDYSRGIATAGNRVSTGGALSFEDAEKEVNQYVVNKLTEKNKVGASTDTVVVKDKTYLEEKKRRYRKLVVDCLNENNISIRGYSNDEFINEMVAELAGYSVLEDAFQDPAVTDIFCINWDMIFVERNGRNERYHKNFRNPLHYKNTIERFIREDGQEINIGSNKKVDFELYGDRGAATSTAISPKGYSMTLRKHREDHITINDLLDQNLLNHNMKDFFDLIVDGESNLIYAGITGSGKTTSLRAIIDDIIANNEKRTLVCEDTQELFLRNDHTLELVSFNSEDKSQAVSLQDLVYAALRLKPKYIVIGEIRGLEAQAAVEAMETGHSTLTTMHADTTWNAINRLINKYLEAMPSLSSAVAERIVCSALDFVVIQDDILGIGRKITTVDEVSYDFDNNIPIIKNIFKFDFDLEDFVMNNRISPDKINHLNRRGVSRERTMKWEDTGDEEVERKFIEKVNEEYLTRRRIEKIEEAVDNLSLVTTEEEFNKVLSKIDRLTKEEPEVIEAINNIEIISTGELINKKMNLDDIKENKEDNIENENNQDSVSIDKSIEDLKIREKMNQLERSYESKTMEKFNEESEVKDKIKNKNLDIINKKLQ